MCFTGEISRFKQTDTKVKKDHILKGDNGKQTTIHLELLNNDETSLVIGIYIPADISGAEGRVSDYKNVIKRFESEQWPDDVTSNNIRKTQLDVDGLQNLLENEKLDSTFTLFNYIQQEETCHFLKLDESTRHNKISHLFGTTKETDKVTKLDLLSEKLKEKIYFYTPVFTNAELDLAQLSKPTIDENDKENNLGSGKLSIFSDLSSNTVEQLEAYRNNLKGVDWVLKNPLYFESIKFNHLIKQITIDPTTQLDSYMKFGVVDSYDEIVKLTKHYSVWKSANKKANIYNELIKLYDDEPNTLNEDILNKYKGYFPTQYDKSASDVIAFDSLSKTNGSLSSLLIKINENRDNLLSNYREHLGHDDTTEYLNVPCPLCGDLKPKLQDLLDEYNVQTTFFEGQLGENGKSLTVVTKNLIKRLVIPLVSKMRLFVTKYDKYIHFDFENLKKIKNIEKLEFERMVVVKNWLISNIGDCSSFTDKSLLEINENYSESKEQLITFINSHIHLYLDEVPKTYLTFVHDFKTLNLAFDENDKLSINSNDISKDLTLLSRLMVQQNSTSYKAKEIIISDLKEKLRKLTVKRTEIMDLSKKYKYEIKAYEKDVAKHIAIPLFVYSSKILQSRPEGSGIFLITPETNNAKGFMQFSATPNDSHDAWNTMSSGQLAGVVISFMLAMNKVYPSKLSTLMIDDPVQTMDEVNMASFVQMMRYEFPDMQVLLSTHESKVANYFHYKYSEAGLKSLPINMKKKRLEA